MLDPFRVGHVPASLVATPAATTQVCLSARTTFLPHNEVVNGQWHVVGSAVLAPIASALVDGPRHALRDLALTLPGDRLGERSVRSLRQDLRLQQVRLPQEALPVGEVHVQLDGLQTLDASVLGEHRQEQAAFPDVNGASHLDRVADLQKVDITQLGFHSCSCIPVVLGRGLEPPHPRGAPESKSGASAISPPERSERAWLDCRANQGLNYRTPAEGSHASLRRSVPTRALNSEVAPMRRDELDVVGSFSVGLDSTLTNRLLERGLEVPEPLARRDTEGGHQRVAEALRKRRNDGVVLRDPLRALPQLVEALVMLLALVSVLGRDVRARDEQDALEVLAQFLVEPTHRAVRPVRLVGLDEPEIPDDSKRFLENIALDQRRAGQSTTKHRGAHEFVLVEADLSTRARERRNLSHVVEQRCPPQTRLRLRLLDDLLRVSPEVLVPLAMPAEAH